MSSTAVADNQPDSPELRELAASPWNYTFYQAVRLLLKHGYSVRFAAHSTFSYPASDIQDLTLQNDRKLARMVVDFMGLTGPMGVLPEQWTDLVIRENRAGRQALGSFLDIFNDRSISLFYQAWEKYRFGYSLERGAVHNPFLHVLRSLMGLGLPELQERTGRELTSDGQPAISDAALAWYTGLLSLQVRSVAALERLLSDFFSVPFEAEQFVPVWRRLEPDVQTQLNDETVVSAQLGYGVVAGDEVLDISSRVRLRIGPLGLSEYTSFLPTGSFFQPLRTLLRFFSSEIEFEAQLILKSTAIPSNEVGSETSRLGWLTWMPAASRFSDACDTILPLSPEFHPAVASTSGVLE